MQFKHGTDVELSDGRHVGSVDRVVMDPNTKEVVGMVIRKGTLFVDDKVVPVSQISSASEQKVVISATDTDSLPNFIETEYVGVGAPVADEDAETTVPAPIYWYPPVGAAMWGYPPISELPIASHKHIPDGTIALHEGARVLSSDGKHVGDIDEVIVEETDHRVSHFVLTKGLLFHDKKLLPMAWVKSVSDEEVQLNVETAILEQVRPYIA